MIRYTEIAFVAYPVTNMERARRFYEEVLGLQPNGAITTSEHWIEYEVGSGTLGIGASPQWVPSKDGPSAALEVEDFDAAVTTLRVKDVPFVHGPLELPTCQMVTIRDPDGNKLTIHKRKKQSAATQA